MSETKLDLNDVDDLCDKALVKLRDQNFTPDTIVGITTGGAVFGLILALKLGVRFCPDYRKYKISNYFELPKDAKKILVVDDKLDLGGTFRKCLKDIIEKLHPEVNAETLSRNMQMPPDLEVKFFAFFDSGDALFSPHFSIYPSLNYDLPWGKPNPFSNAELREAIIKADFPWSKDVIKMFDFFSTLPPPALDRFFSQRPLTKGLLLAFREEGADLVVEISLKKPIDKETLIDFCKESGVVFFGDKLDCITFIDGDKLNRFRYELTEDGKKMKLRFRTEMLRTYDDMCRNCELRELDTPSICYTCNSYLRAIELFEQIYPVLERIYGINSTEAFIKNSKIQIPLGDQFISDLQRKMKK